MKAACFESYGPPDVVQVRTVDAPTPRDGEIRVAVAMSAVTAGDARIRGARFPRGFAPFARLAFGVRRPRNPILGGCFSGVVDAVGSGVTEFRVGDEVCGMTGVRMRAHAEHLVVKAGKAVTRKPAGVSHSDAAGVLFGGTTALYFLRDRAKVGAGARVLVNGASGAVGTNCVQLAKHLGAVVTGVTSARNADLVASLGAEHVLDHTAGELPIGSHDYDVVVDTVGNLSVSDATSMLADGGRAVLVAADLAQMVRPNKRVVTGTAPEKAEDIGFLLALVERGELRVVVDATYDLADIAEAHRRVDSGHKVGSVLVRVAGPA